MKHRLVVLLQSFSADELKNLKKFVKSDYFNTDQLIPVLLEGLLKVFSRGGLTDKNQVLLYSKLYPTNDIKKVHLDEQQKKVLYAKMSVLTKLAKFFLVIEGVKHPEKSAHHDVLLHEALLAKRQFRLFDSTIKKSKQQLAQETSKGISYYFHDHQIAIKQLEYGHINGTLIVNDNLVELNESLDIYYLLNKLKFHLTSISLSVATNKKYDLTMMDMVSGFLKSPKYARHPLIKIYMLAIDLTQKRGEDSYLNMLNLLQEHDILIPRDDLIDFYNLLVNYCVQSITAGQLDYYKELYKVYRIIEEKGLLLETEDFIPINKLKNLIVVSCIVEEYDWAVSMIAKYKMSVKATIREDVCHFNLGLISFYQKKYNEAHEHLIQVGKITAYDINYRILLMKCYYETDKDYNLQTEQFYKTQERFFKDNKALPPKNRKANKNFATMLINLNRVRHRVGKTNIRQVRAKLDKLQVISDKRWLIEKIQEMER